VLRAGRQQDAGQDPFIRLILTLDEGELAMLVRDYCSGAPQPRDAGDQDEDARGLPVSPGRALRARFPDGPRALPPEQ
jgi:hypothetical protein